MLDALRVVPDGLFGALRASAMLSKNAAEWSMRSSTESEESASRTPMGSRTPMAGSPSLGSLSSPVTEQQKQKQKQKRKKQQKPTVGVHIESEGAIPDPQDHSNNQAERPNVDLSACELRISDWSQATPLNHPPLSSKTQVPMVSDPEDARAHCISEPAAETFWVRGPRYLVDSKKEPSAEAFYSVLGVDIIAYKSGELPYHTIQGIPGSTPARHAAEYNTLTFHFQVCSSPYHTLAVTFGRLKTAPPLPPVVEKFLSGSSAERDESLKLIPRVVNGPWLVRQGIGSQPCILGKQIDCSWSGNKEALECTCHVASEIIARALVPLITGAASYLVMDLAFVVEGKTAQDLPERLLGSVRLARIDLSQGEAV